MQKLFSREGLEFISNILHYECRQTELRGRLCRKISSSRDEFALPHVLSGLFSGGYHRSSVGRDKYISMQNGAKRRGGRGEPYFTPYPSSRVTRRRVSGR